MNYLNGHQKYGVSHLKKILWAYTGRDQRSQACPEELYRAIGSQVWTIALSKPWLLVSSEKGEGPPLKLALLYPFVRFACCLGPFVESFTSKFKSILNLSSTVVDNSF